MSRTLARIRRATGDDILVRTGRTMTPTPRALALREETRDLVNRARAVLTPVQTLHLDTLDRTFTLRCHDALVAALAPALTTAIERDAPNARRGRLHGVIDDVLAARGLRRRVLAALPTTAAALELAAQTDLVTVVAEQMCRPNLTRLGRRSRPVPAELPAVPVILAWHHRYDTDPAHA